MNLTRTSIIRLIRSAGITVIILLVISFVIWRSLNYARGPQITITEPRNGSTVIEKTAVIRGQALRINSLTLNGQPIFIDEKGNFAEVLTIFSGVNIITVVGNDQFGRSTQAELRVVGSPWSD